MTIVTTTYHLLLVNPIFSSAISGQMSHHVSWDALSIYLQWHVTENVDSIEKLVILYTGESIPIEIDIVENYPHLHAAFRYHRRWLHRGINELYLAPQTDFIIRFKRRHRPQFRVVRNRRAVPRTNFHCYSSDCYVLDLVCGLARSPPTLRDLCYNRLARRRVYQILYPDVPSTVCERAWRRARSIL